MPNAILVTGGRGFVGTNLVAALARTNVVTSYDTMERSSPTEAHPPASYSSVLGDILDTATLRSTLGGVDSVVHLAAYGSVVESISEPERNFRVNVQGTFNVLKAALDSGIRRVVLASTGGALIGNAVPPVSEASLPKPISPYGASKLCGEAYAHAFAHSSELHALSLRFANVYGPHSLHKRGAVTTFMKALMRGEPIRIYGDGSASRDYIHVDDLCDGIALALDAEVGPGEVFHLAGGRETTVLELATILRDISGMKDHPIEFVGARRGEVERNFAYVDRAHAAFGFSPKWSLEDGLASTWEWFMKHRDLAMTVDESDS